MSLQNYKPTCTLCASLVSICCFEEARTIHSGGQGGQLPPPGKLIFFSNIVFDQKPCLYTGDPCEGLWSLPPQMEFAPADKKSLVRPWKCFAYLFSYQCIVILAPKNKTSFQTCWMQVSSAYLKIFYSVDKQI